MVVRGRMEKIQNGPTGDKRFEDEGEVGVQHQQRGARLYSGDIRGGSHNRRDGVVVRASAS